MRGRVTRDRDAVVPLDLVTADASTISVDAVLDTGFNGFLTLPENVIQSLDAVFVGNRRATLGDGSVVSMDQYLAQIVWEDAVRHVLVLEADGPPLLGMTLLDGHRVVMEVRDDGLLTIDPLRSP